MRGVAHQDLELPPPNLDVSGEAGSDGVGSHVADVAPPVILHITEYLTLSTCIAI